jgi:outer membrane protein
MKIFFITIFFFLSCTSLYSSDSLIFYIEAAYKKNPKLNSERENLKSVKQNINISRSEFLPEISVTGSINNKESTNRTNQSGAILDNTSIDTETKKIEVDQKIFQGFQGYNSFKKSELEVKQANLNLINLEQETIINAVSAYFNLIYTTKNKKFNLANVDLFERQVETDSVRVQKGEITLTDLAQSESSLAGARAKLILADTELTTTKANFERIIRISPPEKIVQTDDLKVDLPETLKESLILSDQYNPKLLIAKLDYEISKKNVDIEKAQLSPSASINYSKSEIAELSSTVDNTDQESVKATITWPIIKGGKNYSSIKKSKFKSAQSNLILQDTVNEIKTETANAWSVYQSSESIFKATQAQVEAAEIANEGISLEYDSGSTRTTLDVIQSRSLLLEARIANAKAERDFVVSKFKLLAFVGKLTLKNIK